MHRRTVLAAAGAAAIPLGGCLGTAEEGATVSVELSPKRYLAGALRPEAANQREVEPGDVRELAELPEPLRAAIEAAVDGGFERQTVSPDLLRAIDSLRGRSMTDRVARPYVRVDGRVYVFEPEVPELLVEPGPAATPANESAVFDARDFHERAEEFDPAVGELVQALKYNGPNAPRVPHSRSSVPETVRDFLERYDYLEDARGVFGLEVTWRHTEPPYRIAVREITDEDRYGRRIVDASALSSAVRSFCESAVAASTRRPSPPFLPDSVPDAFFETLQPEGSVREDPFVRLDGTVYYVGVTRAEYERVPVDVAVEPRSPGTDDRPGFTVRLSVTDGGDTTAVAAGEPVELFGHAGLPGVLWIDHDGEYHLLNSDDYVVDVERESALGTAAVATMVLQVGDQDLELYAAETRTESTSWSLDLDGERVREATVVEAVPVGQDRTATYTVPDAVPSGTYRLPGFFGARWPADPPPLASAVYPFEVELALDRA